MITLSSDFGSPYPAAMKGVIIQESDARLVDIAHDFPRQDIRAGAFWLREVVPYFPPAVHLVVIDPGVGTDRDAVVIRVGSHALVGPDNGVLIPVAHELAAKQDAEIECFRIEVADPASATFHGRDVFAPAAARVHDRGVDSIQEIDGFTPTERDETLSFPEAATDETGATGEVLVVDGFGNVITNVPGTVLADRFGTEITVNGTAVPVRRSYAHLREGEALATVGSHENVEIAVNQGRGDEWFGLSPGERVRLEF
jgi:S-adenosylmethionine hydrolase